MRTAYGSSWRSSRWPPASAAVAGGPAMMGELIFIIGFPLALLFFAIGVRLAIGPHCAEFYGDVDAKRRDDAKAFRLWRRK